MEIYQESLRRTVEWLLDTTRHGQGGSCAYWAPVLGWSDPYPETTGYLIPTLISYGVQYNHNQSLVTARALGDWLLSIQHIEGYWYGGIHPATSNAAPSVFNTAQILKGLMALFSHTGEEKWLVAATHGARWLASGVDDAGQWRIGNYLPGRNPSYYTQVAWPMLEVWNATGESNVLRSAKRVLDAILAMQKSNGVIPGWGFSYGRTAFTHTIAYTLRGALESARLLDDWGTYGAPVVKPLEVLRTKVEMSGGWLAGAFSEDWQPTSWYTCLTGNAQLAICYLILEERENDLRLVNTAAKLVDSVCNSQRSPLQRALPSLKGAVAGSQPVWGRYMFLRYPNWAAKYHSDALMRLMYRLQKTGMS